MVGLMLYDRFNPAEPLKSQGKIDSRWHSLIDSLKLSGTVVIGTLCGFLFKSYLMLPTGINLYVLIVLIFFVGIQLRNNGISLKEALFNKRGFQTGMVFHFYFIIRWYHCCFRFGYANYTRAGICLWNGLVFVI